MGFFKLHALPLALGYPLRYKQLVYSEPKNTLMGWALSPLFLS